LEASGQIRDSYCPKPGPLIILYGVLHVDPAGIDPAPIGGQIRARFTFYYCTIGFLDRSLEEVDEQTELYVAIHEYVTRYEEFLTAQAYIYYVYIM
jgi:hypothetical protein